MKVNPFLPVDPDNSESGFRDLPLNAELEYTYFNTNSYNYGVIAERGFGAPTVISDFVNARRDTMPLQPVIWNLKHVLPSRQSPIQFYQALVRLLLNESSGLSIPVHDAGLRVTNPAVTNLAEIQADLRLFFEGLRGLPKPVLLVILFFDRMPDTFQMTDNDWRFLRDVVDHSQLACLLVSRRHLLYIETLHSADSSIFCSRFDRSYKMGLASRGTAAATLATLFEHFCEQHGTEARETTRLKSIFAPLERHMLAWCGTNPYCLRQLGAIVFREIERHGAGFTLSDLESLKPELSRELRDYFERLLNHLEQDKLSLHLVEAIESEPAPASSNPLDMLEELGYIIPRVEAGSLRKRYDLFSLLFREFLVDRGMLKSPANGEPASPGVPNSSRTGNASPTVPGTGTLETKNHPARSDPAKSDIVPAEEHLTERELEVLQRVARGLEGPEIARELSISKHTVAEHMKKILPKLGAHTRAEAVQIAIKRKLIRGS